jgi:hypothetical protein
MVRAEAETVVCLFIWCLHAAAALKHVELFIDTRAEGFTYVSFTHIDRV